MENILKKEETAQKRKLGFLKGMINMVELEVVQNLLMVTNYFLNAVR